MDLMAEIKLNSDYKRATSAPVWLKGGNVLNGHHAQRSGRGQQEDWPEDELGESNIKDLADIQVRADNAMGTDAPQGHAVLCTVITLGCV